MTQLDVTKYCNKTISVSNSKRTIIINGFLSMSFRTQLFSCVGNNMTGNLVIYGTSSATFKDYAEKKYDYLF